MSVATAPFSALQAERLAFAPPLPIALTGATTPKEAGVMLPAVDTAKLVEMFPNIASRPKIVLEAVDAAASAAGAAAKPLRIGCILSGGQAAGGHSLIAGLYDSIKAIHPESILFGFLDGPRGLFNGVRRRASSRTAQRTHVCSRADCGAYCLPPAAEVHRN